MNQISKAFAALRKQGFIARQSFQCCSGCAGNQIGNEFDAMAPDQRAQILGSVFYHKQDKESFTRTGKLHIRFGQIETAKDFRTRLSTRKVGQKVVEALKAEGLDVQWDGSPSATIVVQA